MKNQKIENLINAAIDDSGYTRSQLLGRKRTKILAKTRQALFILVNDLQIMSIADVGRYFDRDHTTVLHALNKRDDLVDYIAAITCAMPVPGHTGTPAIKRGGYVSVNDLFRDYQF